LQFLIIPKSLEAQDFKVYAGVDRWVTAAPMPYKGTLHSQCEAACLPNFTWHFQDDDP
jgi:hypothetical protein